MTETKSFVQILIEDEEVITLLTAIRDKADALGEDGDKWLSFLNSAIAGMYDNMDSLIANLEGIKFGALSQAVAEAAQEFSALLRENEPDRMDVT